MEKVIYVLLGEPAADITALGRVLRTETVAALGARGGRRIQVNLVDTELGPPFGVAPEPEVPHLAAAVSWWVDTAEGHDISRLLPDAGSGASWSGYLVCEAEPLANTTVPPEPDGRLPGFAQLVLLSRPGEVGWGEWRRRWQGNHTAVALGTQSTFRYVQNVVFRPLTGGAPPYAALVEECFPPAAASDLHVFFDAVGDDQRLARHMAAMSESCDRFMDGAAPVSWTTQYHFPDSG